MFNPGYALFQPQAADALTYQPNKSSSINPEHLSFFKFVGRIIGKALHDQRILEAYFSRCEYDLPRPDPRTEDPFAAVYKHMLGKPVDHRDLESIDPEYHKSLVWMLENDIDGVLDLTFSVERDDFGVTEVVDLVPDGRNIVVTNENKVEYVRLIADQRLSADIKDQISVRLASDTTVHRLTTPVAGSPQGTVRDCAQGPPPNLLRARARAPHLWSARDRRR
jgi:E3 ubiquitin-protein ligase HUWE1